MEQPLPAQLQYHSGQAELPARQPHSQPFAGASDGGASPMPAASYEDEARDEISSDEHVGSPFEDEEAMTPTAAMHADARTTSDGVGVHMQHAQPLTQAERLNINASSGTPEVDDEGPLNFPTASDMALIVARFLQSMLLLTILTYSMN